MTKVSRRDSYLNAIIGSGLKGVDPLRSTRFVAPPFIDDQTLARLYKNALAARIVDLPADEVLRRGIRIETDKDENIVQTLDDLGYEAHFSDAVRWSRNFGGSVIFMLINDGGQTDEPVNEENIQTVESLTVYDKREVQANILLYNKDPKDKNFGQPEFYQITPAGGTTFYVHHSRLLIFDGEPLGRQERLMRGGWGMTAIERLIENIRQSDTGMQLARQIVERFSQPVLSVQDLFDKVTTEDGDKNVMDYLNLIDLARSVINTVAIDKEDTFQLHNVPLAGLPDLLDKFGQYVAAMCGIPFSILFCRAPTGLQATGQSDLEILYGLVSRIQTRKVKPNLDKLIRYIQLAKDGYFKGKPLDNWKIEFKDLWVPTEKEQADTRKTNAEAEKHEAETLKIYVDMNALDPSEAREYLKSKAKYPIDDSLDKDLENDEGDTV